MTTRFFLEAMLRESRGARGRLVFFIGCLAIGVAAVVGVAGLISSIEAGIRAQSRTLLGADLEIESRRPLPEGIDALLAPGVERTDVKELATMAASPETSRSQLVELKVVDGRYPLFGELGLEPERPLHELLDAESTVVAPELLRRLDVEVGESISVGGALFRVAGIVVEEPGRLGVSFTMGPRVFIDGDGLARTPLLGFGSRVRHGALLLMPGDATREELDAERERLQAELPDAEYLDIDTHHEAQPSVRRGLRRAERFLGLVALLSLILGGIGVAQIVRAWLAHRTPSIAILRCLGMRPREIAALYVGHVLLLALVGSAAGAAIGSALPLLVTHFAPDLVPPELVQLWQPAAVLRGVGLGLLVAILFSLPPLTALWRVPPARVLRAEAAPLPPRRGVALAAGAILVLGVFGAAWAQADDVEIGASFAGGVLVLAWLLSLGARFVMRAAGRLPRERLSPYLLHGVAALARPGAGTTGAIVALGLGVMVVASMLLVERRVTGELEGALPDDAPTAFLVDVQPEQWDGVRAILEEEGARSVDSVAVVTGRLASIDGRPVSELLADEEGPRRRRWILTREQRLARMDELPDDNEVVDGALWSDPGRAEVSLEVEYAEDLGAEVGTVLGFDVQGREIEFVVTSLRTVEWESFNVNFFVAIEPGELERAPHWRLATARLSSEAEDAAQDRLALAYGNVTMIRVRAIVEQVVALLTRLAFGIRALGTFTIVTGLVILAGAVSATTLRRARETALLKTLGVTRRGVALLLATEYALGGLVAGLLGGVGAVALSWGFLEFVVEIDPELPYSAIPLAGLVGAVLAALCGVAASLRALSVKPLAVLRG